MSYNNPPGGYGDQPPPGGGYGGQPQGGGYGGQPQGGGYGGQPQGGYGDTPPGNFGPPPGGYAGPPPGYQGAQGGYGGPPPGYGGAPATMYANWINRVGGYLIDVIPVAIIVGIGRATGSAAVYFLFVVIGIAVTAYNRWYMAGKTGQSWGKKALHLSLISESTGQPIGAGMAFVRDIAHIVDSIICYVGWLFPLWDSKRQTLADKIVKTVVVPVN